MEICSYIFPALLLGLAYGATQYKITTIIFTTLQNLELDIDDNQGKLLLTSLVVLLSVILTLLLIHVVKNSLASKHAKWKCIKSIDFLPLIIPPIFTSLLSVSVTLESITIKDLAQKEMLITKSYWLGIYGVVAFTLGLYIMLDYYVTKRYKEKYISLFEYLK